MFLFYIEFLNYVSFLYLWVNTDYYSAQIELPAAFTPQRSEEEPARTSPNPPPLQYEGDKIMEELSKQVKKLNQDQDILDVITRNEDELIRNTLYEKAIQKGISQGISQGIEQKAEEIARKMLQEKLDINFISKITGLSNDEIKKLT